MANASNITPAKTSRDDFESIGSGGGSSAEKAEKATATVDTTAVVFDTRQLVQLEEPITYQQILKVRAN